MQQPRLRHAPWPRSRIAAPPRLVLAAMTDTLRRRALPFHLGESPLQALTGRPAICSCSEFHQPGPHAERKEKKKEKKKKKKKKFSSRPPPPPSPAPPPTPWVPPPLPPPQPLRPCFLLVAGPTMRSSVGCFSLAIQTPMSSPFMLASVAPEVILLAGFCSDQRCHPSTGSARRRRRTCSLAVYRRGIAKLVQRRDDAPAPPDARSIGVPVEIRFASNHNRVVPNVHVLNMYPFPRPDVTKVVLYPPDRCQRISAPPLNRPRTLLLLAPRRPIK